MTANNIEQIASNAIILQRKAPEEDMIQSSGAFLLYKTGHSGSMLHDPSNHIRILRLWFGFRLRISGRGGIRRRESPLSHPRRDGSTSRSSGGSPRSSYR